MYDFLIGNLAERQANRLVLDVGGVGYDLITPLGASFGPGPRLKVYVHLQVREDAHLLYGFPDRATRVLELIRQTRAGALNDVKYGQRFTGTGVYADMLASRFTRAARQWGMEKAEPLDCTAFAAPAAARAGFAESQLSLF